jgi:hypothetical protein
MGVVGELCTSRLCSFSSFFYLSRTQLGILRLIIIFFYVHSFDAWYVEIAHLSHPQAVFMTPQQIYKAVLFRLFLLTPFCLFFPRSF